MLKKKKYLVTIQTLLIFLVLSPLLFSQSYLNNSISFAQDGLYPKESIQLVSSIISSKMKSENEVVVKKSNKDFKYLVNENTPEMFNEVILAWPVGGEKISNTSPKLSWIRKSSSSETIYELEYGTIEDMSNATTILSLTTNQIILDGLEPSTKYFWRIRSIDGNNYTSYSQLESFETNSPDYSIGTEGLTKGYQ